MLIRLLRQLAALRLFIAGVVEARVADPGDVAEFDVFEGCFYKCAGFHISNFNTSPVTATYRELIGHQAAVGREADTRHTDRAIVAEGIWI